MSDVDRRWTGVPTRRVGRAFTLLALLLGAAPVAAAQGGAGRGAPGREPLREPARAEGRRAGGDAPGRAAIERRLQERLLAVVKQRLGLTEEQTARLREVASKTEDDRRALRRDELTSRFAMRQELLAGDKANEAKVADLLEEMPRLERRRVELMEKEQRELAKFLSPIQRARYFGLQEELRRGMQELQQQRLAAPDSAPPLRRPGAGLLRKRLGPPPPP